MTDPKFWFDDKRKYDQIQRDMPSCMLRYRETARRVDYRSGPYESQTIQYSTTRQLIPSICQSQPLIAAKGPDRDTRHTVATSHWEYQEEQLWSRQKTTKAHDEIRLLAKTTKRLLCLDSAYNALTDKHQICSSGLTSTPIWDMAKSNWEYKEQERDHSNKKTIAFGDARLGAETNKELLSSDFTHKNLFEKSQIYGPKSTSPFMRNTSSISSIGQAPKIHQSTLSELQGNSESTKGFFSNRGPSPTSEKATSNMKRFVYLGLFILVLWLAFPSPSINTRTVGQGVSMEKLADEFIVQIQSTLYGQHIATEVIKSSLRHALVNKDTKVVTLLMIGPVGSGKSFTSRMLQYVLKAKGFAISRASYDLHHLDITNNCRHWRNYQNLAIVIDGAGDDFQGELKSGDFIIGLKHCSNFNKILIIIESCAFAKEIKQYIFSQCKFNDDRLSIQSKNVIDYISMTKGISLNFENGDSRHVILPIIFLPLDVNHVKMCIQHALLLRGIDKEKWTLIIDDVIRLFEFYPQCGMRYPEVGCKLVNSRVDYVINRDDVQKYYIHNKKT